MLPVQSRGAVLAVYPSRRGFGFAVATAPVGLSDWGWAKLASRSADELLVRVDALVARHAALHLVLENPAGSRRRDRVRRLTTLVGNYGRQSALIVHDVARSDRRTALGLPSRATNHEMAVAVALLFPELEPQLPRLRKRWQAEDERLAIFAAVASLLAIGSVSFTTPV